MLSYTYRSDPLLMEDGNNEMQIKATLAANDPSALEMIWNEHASDLLGYLVTLHGSRHEAEDTMQEVFVVIATKRACVASAGRRCAPCRVGHDLKSCPGVRQGG
jgi:hypothetical protein